ncbi:MAG: hypothetical protein ACREPY_00210 [Rhodanobacteraceae bacterium]
MRGKIIQYNGNDGSGTLVADGKQYRFTLVAWRGDSAPAVNKIVELTLEGDTVGALVPVGDDILLKEKAAELGGKVGASWSKLRASIPASAGAVPSPATAGSAAPATGGSPAAAANDAMPGGTTVNAILQRYGKAIPIAWVLFLLGTLAFNAVSVSVSVYRSSLGKSWFDIASLMSQMGADGGSMVKVLLLAGYASIAVPLFWHDRRAWWTLAVPLLALLWAIFSVLHTLSSVSDSFGRGMSDMFSLGFGFYLSLLAALVLAVLGFKRSFSAN